MTTHCISLSGFTFHSEHETHENEIIPHLFLGSEIAFFKATHKNPMKIHRIVRVLPDPAPFSSGLNILHLPLPSISWEKLVDLGTRQENATTFIPPKEWFEPTFNFIEEGLRLRENVLIHCRQGASRSPTLLMAFLMRRYALSYEDVLDLVQSKRPCVNLDQDLLEGLVVYSLLLR